MGLLPDVIGYYEIGSKSQVPVCLSQLHHNILLRLFTTSVTFSVLLHRHCIMNENSSLERPGPALASGATPKLVSKTGCARAMWKLESTINFADYECHVEHKFIALINKTSTCCGSCNLLLYQIYTMKINSLIRTQNGQSQVSKSMYCKSS
jgi:hypothetical protein